MSNLDLWNRHMKPHPDALKKFRRGGGFSGTAIDPMWVIREATEEWGPIGGDWGFEIVEQRIYEFEDVQDLLHTVLIRIWYPVKDKDGEVVKVGHVESFGQTMMAGTNKNGFYVDEEAPKKSVTDALTKGMSWLGFGAAVHMGMFDGNKYVDFRGEPQGDKPEVVTTQGLEPPPEIMDDIDDLVSENLEILCNRIGKEKAIEWHKRVMENFFGGKKRAELSKVELAQLADLQNQRIKSVGGNDE